jgi:protein-tyrosine phosphatase
MVCLGNICRSPLAEGILKDKLKKRNISATVDSSGTSDYHFGQHPDSRTIHVAKNHNINISSHRGRHFSVKDFDLYDKIYTMDLPNYRNVLNLSRNDNDRIKVEMILNVSNPGRNLEIPDPYYSGNDGFELVYRMLDNACEMIADSIENKNND